MTLGDDMVTLAGYTVIPPMKGFDGDLEAVPMYAGQLVERIDTVVPAAMIIDQIMNTLRAVT